MQTIRIMYIVNHAVPYGANVSLLNILSGVVDAGIVPMVIVGNDGALCEELKKRHIPYLIIKHNFNIYPKVGGTRSLIKFLPNLVKSFILNIKAEKKLTMAALKFKPDLIHTNIGPTHIGYNVAKRLNIPHVWHIREYQDLGLSIHPFPSKSNFIKKLNSVNNYPVATTKGIFDHYKMQKNAHIIYNGLDTSKMLFNDKKEKYFLFVGRLEEEKGIKNVIQAFISYSKDNQCSDYKMLIAGSGQERFVKKLHDIVTKSNLQDRICFLGFRKDVHDLMANATAIIVASRCEGFGLITVEAILRGCLVIGNNTGGTKEILEKDKIGILYSGNEELVYAMKTVVNDGIHSYFTMIKKAQVVASMLYSRENLKKNIYNLYLNILNNKNYDNFKNVS